MFVISETRYLSTSARRRLGEWEGPGSQVLSVLGLGDPGSMLQFAALLSLGLPSIHRGERIAEGGDLSKVSQ